MASNKIPGVYSEIDASAALKTLSANDYVICIIAKGVIDDTTLQLTNKAYAPTSFDDAKLKYGATSNIVKLMGTAIDNGGTKFIVVRVDDTIAENPDYKKALEISELEEAIDIVIVDSMNPTVFTDVKTSVVAASTDRKERTAVIGIDTNTDIPAAVTSAVAINSGRMLMAYPNPLDNAGVEVPGYYTAAAVAGQLAKEQDPSMPLTGVELVGFYGLAKKLKVTEMETLIDAGIIPLEINNGTISIVRCITTYTKDSLGAADTVWQEITTVRISDYIFKDLRLDLAKRFRRSKQSKDTRDAIRSRVLTKLLTYEELDYLEEVVDDDVEIAINPSNPLRNDVQFKYDVTGPLNIINLTGHLVI
jgi:phage tail sheath gpL-like